MLKKIDCVMIRVEDLTAAEAFYRDVLGLKPLWRDTYAVGMGLPETDAEIVLHHDPGIPEAVEVYYLVDAVPDAVSRLRAHGCAVILPPFDITIGQCAIVRDPFGMRLCLLDMSTGPRELLPDGE